MEEGEIPNGDGQKNGILEEGERTPEWDQERSLSKHRKAKIKKNKKRSRSKEKERDKKNKKKHKKDSNRKEKKEDRKIIYQQQKSRQPLEEQKQEQSIGNQQQQQEGIIIQVDNDENVKELDIEDEEAVFLRRRQMREELFKQLEQEIQVSPDKENNQGFMFDQPQQQIDENKQSYFRMLDQQRNLNNQEEQQQQQTGQPQKKIILDMFDELDDELENDDLNMMVRHNTNASYEADDDKYYRITIGEMIKDYKIINKCGKGVFGNVCKAIKDGQEYAIKFIRAEDIYIRSGERERQILKQLNEADSNNKKHILRLIESFEHRKHLCLVFESLDLNLRDALKVYTKGQGLDLPAIRSYAMQLFVALAHLRKHKIIHADIKPDNILISADTKLLKLCDFGTAFTVDEVTVVEYLVSRYYRAPEIIIGYPYDTNIDVWATACTLYELFTGQFLFSGDNNNDMLKLHLQTMGKFSMKMLRRSALTSKYFDQHLNFKSREIDPITKQVILKPVLLGEKPTRTIGTLLKNKEQGLNAEDQKMLLQFKDLLEKCLQLDPKNRITPEDALYHPFINVAMANSQSKKV
ncbi:unnamed protein product [Paramecium pentaurelia]|uniref:non-specific serine/threonine protein kinase n=1 Tax=Paramecium pentaurelia TaxID=43138 RepID=A0A8S1TNZ4_9CILI|nr:unnamed protein product [Paramecium pentaurelia]